MSSSPPTFEISLGTPALLFPAISLLMLAYTNRFLALASLIRSLHQRYQASPDQVLLGQIQNLRRRLGLVRRMQTLGVLSLFVCVVCMFTVFAGEQMASAILFAVSLVLLLLSLGHSLAEIHISTEALKLELGRMETGPPSRGPAGRDL